MCRRASCSRCYRRYKSYVCLVRPSNSTPAIVVKNSPQKRSKSAKVATRPGMLPNEVLLDILKCTDRRSLDNMYLMRRFEPLLDHCDQLRTVSEAYFSYSSSTYNYSVGFAKKIKTKERRNIENRWPYMVTQKTLFADISVDAKSLKRAVDVFTNALRHSHVTGEVRLENVELSRYFVKQMKAINNGYVIDGSSLVVRRVSLKLDVNPTDFITAFCSLRALSKSAAEWFDFVGLDDCTLKHFAANGILQLCHGNMKWGGAPLWNCRKVSEDALIDIAFNDSYGEAGLRYFSGQDCRLSPMFLRKLVQARRASTGTYKTCLHIYADDRLRAEQDLDGLLQFRLQDDDDDEEDPWQFKFPDIPNFRIQYDHPFGAGGISCWSNINDE